MERRHAPGSGLPQIPLLTPLRIIQIHGGKLTWVKSKSFTNSRHGTESTVVQKDSQTIKFVLETMQTSPSTPHAQEFTLESKPSTVSSQADMLVLPFQEVLLL